MSSTLLTFSDVALELTAQCVNTLEFTSLVWLLSFFWLTWIPCSHCTIIVFSASILNLQLS